MDTTSPDQTPSSEAPVDVFKNPYRVMVVDDSAVIRGLTTKIMEADPKITVVASVADGQQAVKSTKNRDVEVIVLDIEMPVMDGLTAIPLILQEKPYVQIIMSSTLTQKNAEVSMKALQAGASDYIPKPTSNSEISGAQDFKLELIHKVKALGAAVRRTQDLPLPQRQAGASTAPAAEDEMLSTAGADTPERVRAPIGKEVVLRAPFSIKPSAIAVGSSTGGPPILMKFFKELSQDIDVPIFVTQHMPPTFTKILSDHIARDSGRPCHEASEGMPVESGHIYVAPGDYHMTLEKRVGQPPCLRMVQTPPENFCRPSVDPMVRSILDVYGPKILGVMFTGMGHDGLGSFRDIVEAGGRVIAQDEASSVVWGMPGAVAMDGLCTDVLPADQMPQKVAAILEGGL